MTNEEAATCLAELGNTHRLTIFRYLVKAGHDGASVGEVQRQLDIPGSTLSHHLSRMANAGLIRQVKRSRVITCLPNFQLLEELTGFLQDECCMGHEAASGTSGNGA
ncbi:helix-turn-helix domain-containing protein [Marinobacter sp. 71-i]|uniref:Helix-turn-helix domain-containing protein n=1 Tax=Marinobacter iranensis TaxID=2962607 RepID=A0ABT5YBI5_9GAMM|nr:helix-turn-helix domain-containing protein [Marinobacter iranensis]MDF0751025.1 helix-turn-helix domain-containing protein [Marinobacter iranensis]